tara:strand:+ start:499 stop:828 length:330 start_codon:yes stop_codon:yes gene_type:complete
MTTIYDDTQNGGYMLKGLMNNDTNNFFLKYSHLSIPAGLFCRNPVPPTNMPKEQINYNDVPIVDNKLFNKFFTVSEIMDNGSYSSKSMKGSKKTKKNIKKMSTRTTRKK